MGHSERQNEYFIEKDGISREVIQADICRYLGNDALVKPGVHQVCLPILSAPTGRQGYFIRAYRNLTSEMIADLKADSARWEAETSRRAERGYPRGNYVNHDVNMQQGPNRASANYNTSSIHESRQQATYAPPTSQPYMDPYSSSQTPYPPQQNSSGYSSTFNQPSGYPSDPISYGSVPNAYAQGQSSAPVTSAEMQSSYTYSQGNAYPYGDSRSAPRYTGQGYDNDSPDFPSGVSSGMGYPPSTAPDSRMDPRYSPESAYPDPRGPAGRAHPPRDRDPQRRPR
ncbi:hypothetical protein LOZ66_000134 [Ophidiomyces ophidiicola]|nr:hypothetical protein LOZ66_000134 [Ophidiomyces ophidiicola]